MFQVIKKDSQEVYNVYDIKYDKAGYPLFVFYKNGQWLIKSAKYFKPNVRWANLNSKQRTKLESIISELENIISDEEDKLANLEENFSGTERYEKIEEGISALEEAIENIQTAIDV